MARRHYISNRNWWLAVGIAFLVVCLPVGVAGAVWFVLTSPIFAEARVAAERGFAATFPFNPESTVVWRKNTKVTTQDIWDLVRARQIDAIRFTNCEFDQGALASLGNHQTISTLVFNACHGDFGELRELALKSSLVGLEITDSWMTGEEAKAIGEIKSLERLTFTCCFFEEPWIPSIARLPALDALSLKGTRATAQDLADLVRLPSLRYLDVSNTGVDDAFATTIEHIPRLREITVRASCLHAPVFPRAVIERLRTTNPHLIVTDYQNLWLPPSDCCIRESVPWADD